MKKRVLTTILAGVLAVSAFAGCGSSNTAGNAAADNNAAAETNDAAVADTTAAESEAAESVADTQTTEGGTITVAASATPHAEILEEAKKILADQGWDLEITIFDDYVLPNEVVESGEFDANYFQHIPYLENFNAEKGTHLVYAGGIHYEPFGIYPGTKKDLSELADGDTIAVPNDTCSAASSSIFMLCGFSAISLTVASNPAPSFKVMMPLSCNSNNALASFVVSFGTAIVSPSANSERSKSSQQNR